MDRPFIGSKNRYALLSDSEDMDPIHVVEQSIKKVGLEEKADTTTVRGSHLENKDGPGMQSKAKGLAPTKPGARSKLTLQTSGNTQHTEDKNLIQDITETNRLNKNHQSQLSALPEKGDDWTETQKKDKIRPRKARGGLLRRDLFNDRGKREFDRLSGSQKSGVKPVEKRDGGGARNWGRLSDNYEILHEDDQTADGTAENAESKTASKPTKADDGPAKQMTLDEWKEQMRGSQSAPVYNLRKPGEGTDQKQWDRFQILKKKTQEDPSCEEVSQVQSNQPKNASKVVKSIDVLFSGESYSGPYQARHGGRGGRHGPKSSDTTQQSAHLKECNIKAYSTPKFDETDFPSLGGT